MGLKKSRTTLFFGVLTGNKVTSKEAVFIPQIMDPELVDYFDPGGAIPPLFHDDDRSHRNQFAFEAASAGPQWVYVHAGLPVPISGDDFGSFSFKNLPVLKQANDDLIRKTEGRSAGTCTFRFSNQHTRIPTMSQRVKKPPNVNTSMTT